MKIINFASSSSGNCYLLQSKGVNILLDCGISYNNIKIALSKENLTMYDIDLILLSHQHSDHAKASKEIKQKNPSINILSCFQTKEVTKIKALNSFMFKHLEIATIPVNHGTTSNYAYVIKSEEETLLFATDCACIEWKLPYQFTKVMIECNFITNKLNTSQDKNKIIRQMNTHMSLDNCIKHLEMMDLTKCKDIYLMHLSDAFSDAILMRSTIRNKFKINTHTCNKEGGFSG